MSALVRISKTVSESLASRITHAQLPASLYDVGSLAEAPFDVVRYVTPWSMEVDLQGRCWIDISATAHEKPGGTVELGVERTVFGISVYPSGDYRWTPSDRVRGSGNYAPVSEVIV